MELWHIRRGLILPGPGRRLCSTLSVTHLIGFGASASAAVQTQIAQGTGTIIGDMTSSGGNAASFDSNTNQAHGSCSYKGANTTDGYVGKDWGAGNDKILTGFRAYSSNTRGFTQAGGTENIVLRLYGKATAPSGPTDGTLLGTISAFANANSLLTKEMLSGLTTTTAYRYHILNVNKATSSDGPLCGEAEFFEDI